MPDADASNNSGFPCRFVQNVLQHHGVLAQTRGCDHQSLCRLAQGDATFVVLHRKVRCHDPINVITEGSRFGSAGVLGFFTVVCASSPQRHDVIIGQVYIVADIHGCNVSVSSSLSVSEPTGDSANTAVL